METGLGLACVPRRGTMATISVDDISLDYEFWGNPESSLPAVLLLHEPAGSVRGWGEFPERLAQATGARVFAYSRQGHGGSDPLSTRLARGYLEREALDVLPMVRQLLQLKEVVLVGLHDGATIGLIHAGGAELPTLGVVAIAPVLFVDEVTRRSIETMARQLEIPALKEAFGDTTSHQDQTFAQWSALWLSPDFQGWHADDYLRMITGKVLAVRGDCDTTSSIHHLERLQGLTADVEVLTLQGCRQQPHLDRPGALISALVGFIREVAAGS